MKIFKNKYWDIIFLMILGLITLTWFRGNFFIKGIDSFFCLNNQNSFYSDLFMWKSTENVGFAWGNMNIIPIRLFAFMLDKIGFSLVNTQKIIIYFIFTFSILSMYIFMGLIFPKNDMRDRLSRIGSALFYTMNIFTLSWIWWRQMLFEFEWIILPILLYLFIKTISSKNRVDFLYYLTISTIIFNILSPAFFPISVFVILIILLVFLIFYIIYIFKIKLRNKIAILKKGLIAIVIWVLSSLWWIIPNFKSIITSYSNGVLNAGATSLDFLKTSSTNSSILNTVRLMGHWFIYQKYGVDYFYTWASNYINNNFLIFLSFLFFILAIISIFSIKKNKFCKNFYLLFAVSLIVIAILIMKGINEPMPFLNIKLLDLPFGAIFRHPYDKFGIILVFSLAILIGFFINIVLNFKRKKIKILILITIFLAFLFYSYPFLNGDVIYSGGQSLPSNRIQIPDYYYQLGKFISKDETQSKVLQLPLSYWGESSLKWPSGIHNNGDPLLQYFINNKSIIHFLSGYEYTDRVPKTISDLISNGKKNELSKYLRLINTKYIVLHNDWDCSSCRRQAPIPLFYQNFFEMDEILNSKKALQFNGESNNVEINDAPFLNNLDSFSVELWVKNNKLIKEQDQNFAGIIGKYGNDNPSGWSIIENKLENSIFFGYKDITGKWYQAKSSSSLIVPNIWYHLVATYNKNKDNGNLNLYIDGNLIASGNSIPIQQNNGPITLGVANNNFFKGKIGAFNFYNKELSNSEIINHFQNQSSYIEGLELNYDFNKQENDQILKDFGPFNWSGKIYGAEWVQTINNSKIDVLHKEQIGKLITYELNQPANLIYSSNKVTLSNDDFCPNSLSTWISQQQIETTSNPIIIFKNDAGNQVSYINQIITNLSNHPNSNPDISFEKINPTKYLVKIKNAKAPFFLIFNESYDSDWSASSLQDSQNIINNLLSPHDAISKNNHFIVNGSFNAWYVDKNGDYTIVLEYKPQKYFYLGLICSGLVLLGILSCLIFFSILKKKKIRDDNKNVEKIDNLKKEVKKPGKKIDAKEALNHKNWWEKK